MEVMGPHPGYLLVGHGLSLSGYHAAEVNHKEEAPLTSPPRRNRRGFPFFREHYVHP